MNNPLYEYGLFGWNYKHLLTHPWIIIRESYWRVKWFVQRGYRGYADCDVWGLDSYLASWMPEALEYLRKNKYGHPCGMTKKGWNSRLDIMRQGFLEVRAYGDKLQTPKEHRVSLRIMQKGLHMFATHFLSLWD